MAEIIRINQLYDSYHDMEFGIVGIDIETGEIKFYSYYDKFDKYNPNALYEFQKDKLNEILSWHMKYCTYKRPKFSDQLPNELKLLLDEFLHMHISFNTEHNYPTNYLDFNQKNLSIQYIANFSLFTKDSYAAIYTPITNRIGLTYSQYDWENMSLEQKRKLKSNMAHELGHMKVARCILDEKNKKVLVKIGFYHSEVLLEPLLQEEGTTIYKIVEILDENKEERAMEEIINDLDCSMIFPFYNCNYPKFGERLNNLCNNRLLYARYASNLEEYYNSLQQIIDSKDLATELLAHITNSIYGRNKKEAEENAYKLIRKYEQEKFNHSSL